MRLFKKHWLSYQVENKLKGIFSKRRENLSFLTIKKYGSHVLFHFVFMLLIFSLCIVIDLREGFSSALNHKTVSELINQLSSILITIPLALVGAIIPIMILTFEFFSSRSETGFMSRYYKFTRLRSFVFVILFVIVLDIGIIILDNISNSVIAVKYAFLFSLLLTLLLIVHVFFYITRTIHTLNIKTFFSVIQSDLIEAVTLDLHREVSARLSRNLFTQICSEYEIEYLAMHRSHLKALRNSKKGQILDINLHKLAGLKNRIKTKMSFGAAPNQIECRLILSVRPQSRLEFKDILGYVHHEEDDALEAELNKCLMVQEPEEKDDLLRSYATEFKDLAIQAINQNAEHLVEQILNGYLSILNYYMDYTIKAGLQIPREHLQELFAEWRALIILINDLRDIMEATQRNPNRSFAELFAHKVYELLLTAIRKKDLLIYKKGINLFVGMYLFARRFDNTIGLNRCTSTLLDVVDHGLNPLVEDSDFNILEIENVEDFRFMYLEAINVLSVMMKTAFDERDTDSFQKMFQAMDEMLVYLSLPTNHFERYDLEEALESDRENEELKRRLTQIKSLEALPGELNKHIIRTWFLMGAYLCQQFQEGNISQSDCLHFITPILPKFNWANLLDSFEFMLIDLDSSLISIWRDWPETRKVVSLDPISKHVLFYCVRGMDLIANVESLPSVKAYGLSFERIKEVCEKIVEEKNKWSWLFVESQIRDIADRFIEFNEAIEKKYNEEQEQEIINAPISIQKVEEAKSRILREYHDFALMRHWLNQHGLVKSDSGRLPEEESYQEELQTKIDLISRLPKDLFLEKPHSNYFGFIERKGIALAEGEDRFIIEKLTKYAATSGEYDTVEMTISEGIKKLKNHENGYTPSLIFVPSGFRYSFRMMQSERFAYTHSSGDERAYCFGYFDNIPVISPFGVETNSILIVDIEKACRLYDIKQATVEIRPLSSEEKKSILERQNGITERQLDLEIVLNIEEEIYIELNDKNAILRVPLKKEQEE